MSTMITNIREVARREHSAEQTRTQAEAAWRAAWWDTTLALAAVQGGNGEAKAAIAAVANELGQTARYIDQRRKVGLRVDLAYLEVLKIKSLPPRLALEHMRAGGAIDQAAADKLLAAEHDGTSLRDFAREQGTQPKSWQREDERTVPEPTAEQRREIAREEIARQPEIVREVMADQPEVVREVARHVVATPADRQTFDRVRQEETERYLNEHGVTTPRQRPRTEFDDGGDEIVARHELAKASGSIRAAYTALAEVVLDEEIKARLVEDVTRVERQLDVLRARIANGSIDEELARFMAGS